MMEPTTRRSSDVVEVGTGMALRYFLSSISNPGMRAKAYAH